MRSTVFFLLFIALLPCKVFAQSTPSLSWSLLRTIPRESQHFTQGLVYADQQLFESTGRYGQSVVIAYDATTFTEQRRKKLSADIFGEGLTFLHGRLYQLSWKSQQLFVYNAALQLLQTLPIQGEGWGLTTDGSSLIMSNGSNTLQFLDPQTGKIQHALPVSDTEKIWTQINELEWIDGYILANIWISNTVLLIDAKTGRVAGNYDFSMLDNAVKNKSADDVLNGLAWNPSTQTLLVTGKNWPLWFEVHINLPRK